MSRFRPADEAARGSEPVRPRTNEAWVRDLTAGSRRQDAALSDLRRLVLRGLRGALAGRRNVDEGFLQDTTQEALIRVLEHLPRFEGRSRFSTWATSIAIRTALTELRRRRWKDISLDQLTGSAEPLLVDPAQEDATGRNDLVATMYRVIRRELTVRQRTALLAELRGMPQSEIARRLGSNRNAVYKLTHDARKRLRRGLEAAGYHAENVRAAFST